VKFIVPIKRVEDTETKIKINNDQKSIEAASKYIINPFDEIALEEALRLREQYSGEVVVISAGVDDAIAQIRAGLAMGADRGIHILTQQTIDPYQASLALAKVIRDEGFDLIIMGKQAIDDDAGQTGLMLAEHLGIPHASFVSKEDSLDSEAEKSKQCALKISENRAIVVREVDNGIEHLALALPALLTTELRLNIPRYASLPGIMKAKSKHVSVFAFSDLVTEASRSIIEKMEYPAKREGGVRVKDVATLVDKLRNEAKVL
jgi:electron transfer flavoprotein beta subunit